MLRLFMWNLIMCSIMFSLCSLTLLSYLCHATCLSEIEKHECYLLMLRLFMCSLTMCCIMFSLCSLTLLSIFMSCYMLIRSSETCVWFTNAETIYVKPYKICSLLCSLTLLSSLCHATCLSEFQKHVYDLLMLRLFMWSLYYGLYNVLPSVVSHYYHLYVMLHAYQKLRNKCAI
jgi:hypothetical protein